MALAFLSAGAASAQRAAAAPQPGEQRTAEGLQARQGEGSSGPVKFDAGDAVFGLRNNNWVGIKGPNLDGRWPGQTGANPHGFARFDDPAYAVRSFVGLILSMLRSISSERPAEKSPLRPVATWRR